MNKWHGLMKVLEVQHLSKYGKVIWSQKNIPNLLHTTGEEYVLRVLFTGGDLPASYYFGLDNRTDIDESDTMTSLAADDSEPTINGYTRQTTLVDSFSMSLSDGINLATGPIVTFSASGGNWGPIRNFFMTNESGDNGYLISSVALASPITVANGESISMRMGFSLKDCP